MHEYVAANEALALRAQEAVEAGDVPGLGAAMKEAQDLFDRTAGKVRPVVFLFLSDLLAP
jgi:hypothetical protein